MPRSCEFIRRKCENREQCFTSNVCRSERMPTLDTAARVRLMTLIRLLFPSPECVQTVLQATTPNYVANETNNSGHAYIDTHKKKISNILSCLNWTPINNVYANRDSFQDDVVTSRAPEKYPDFRRARLELFSALFFPRSRKSTFPFERKNSVLIRRRILGALDHPRGICATGREEDETVIFYIAIIIMHAHST